MCLYFIFANFWILMEFRNIFIKVKLNRLYEAADIIQKLHLIGQVLSFNILIIISITISLNYFYCTYIIIVKQRNLFYIRNGTLFCSELTSFFLIRNCLKTGLAVLAVLLRQSITMWRNP